MKIIVDAFGGDNTPLKILEGCEAAIKSLDIDIVLTDRGDEIRQVAEESQISLERMEIFDAPQVLTMEDHAGAIIKEKKDPSMTERLRLIAEDKGNTFVSTDNSGALVVGATMIVKRIKGIKRVASAPMIPDNKGFFMLIDSGANVDYRPGTLLRFGITDSIYLDKIIGMKDPRVALANVGTKDHKGGELQHQAFAMLKESRLNFIGNIEARGISSDDADVVVMDGFTGNIILRMFGGVVSMVMSKFKEVFAKDPKNRMATVLLLGGMAALKKFMDYSGYGGAPAVGTSKSVFKVHSSAKACTVKSTLHLTKAYVEKNAIEEIKRAISGRE